MSDHSSSMSGSGSEGQPAGKASGNGCKRIAIAAAVLTVVGAGVGVTVWLCCCKSKHSCGGQKLSAPGVPEAVSKLLAGVDLLKLTDANAKKHLTTKGNKEIEKAAELKDDTEICVADPTSTKDKPVKPHGPFKWGDLAEEVFKAEINLQAKKKLAEDTFTNLGSSLAPHGEADKANTDKATFNKLVGDYKDNADVKKQIELAYQISQGNYDDIDKFHGVDKDADGKFIVNSAAKEACVGGDKGLEYISSAGVQKALNVTDDEGLKKVTDDAWQKVLTDVKGKTLTTKPADDMKVCFKPRNVLLGEFTFGDLKTAAEAVMKPKAS